MDFVSDRTKRIVIALIACVVVAGTAWAELEQPARPLLAQEDATATPTPTLTLTPTLTATPTPTGSVTPTPTPTWTPTFVFDTPTPTWTPPFPIASPQGLPSPTRVIRVVTEISHPQSGDAVSGFTAIFGTALMTAYRRYEVAISPAGLDNWEWLYSSFDVKHDDQLFAFDTTAYSDGYYDLRLRTIDDAGEYTDAFLRGMEIRNANPPTVTPVFNDEGTPLPPAPQSPLGTPTPTPRPRIVQYMPEGQGIFSPEIGSVASDFVDILGTAVGYYQKPFERYEMAISTAGNGEWNWLYSSEEQIWQDVLYTLNTRDFADGYYDVRLRIVYRDANYDDYILRYLKIANAGRPDLSVSSPNGIYTPSSGDAVAGIVDFVGTAAGADFLRWEMAWAPSGVDAWVFLTSGERPVVNRTLARLDVNSLGGERIDVRLRVVRPDGNYDDFIVGDLKVLAPTPTPTQPPSPLPGDTPVPPPAPPPASPTPLG